MRPLTKTNLVKNFTKFFIATLTLALPAFFVTPNPMHAQTAAPMGNNAADTTASTCLMGGGPLISDGKSSITLAASLRNVAGQPLSGITVTAGGGMTGLTITPGVAVTDANGLANFTVTSSKPGETRISMGFQGQFISCPVTVGQEADAAHSTVEVSPSTVPADGATPITVSVTLRDASDNLIPKKGAWISGYWSGNANDLTKTPSGATNLGTAYPNDAGKIIHTYTSKGPGTLTAMVKTEDGYAVKNELLIKFTEYVPAQLSSTLSTVTKSSPTGAVLADGEHAASITVLVRDETGKAMANKNVSLISPASAVHVSPAQTTNSSGYAYFTVNSTASGSYDIGALVDGTTLSSKASVQFVKQTSANASLIQFSPASIKADGAETATAEVTVKDEDGNLLAGKDVSLSSAPSGLQFNAALVTTDASGKATFSIKTSTAGTYAVKATVGSTILDAQATLTATAPATSQTSNPTAPTTVTVQRASNYHSSFEAVPTLLPVGKIVSFVLKLRDTSGAAIANRTVSFMVTTNGVLKTQNVTTDANGKGQLDITVTEPGVISTSVLADDAKFIATATVVAATNPNEQPLPTASATTTGGNLTITPTQETTGATIEAQPAAEEEAARPEPKPGRMLWIRDTDTVFYKHPRTLKVYEFNDAAEALVALKGASMRLSQSTFAKIPTAKQNSKKFLPTRRLYAGRLLVTANDKERVWYVHPDTLKRYWFDGSTGSYEFLKQLADKSE